MLLIQIIKCILLTSISIFLLIPSSKATNDTEKEAIPPLIIKLTDIIKTVPSQAPIPKNQMEINNSSNMEESTSKNVDVNGNQNINCNTDQLSKLIEFEERKCKSSRGEYLNTIELADGTKHREEGIIINGTFSIRGYFHSKADPNVNSFKIFQRKT